MNGKPDEGLGRRIRAKAAELGFCKVGFTTMDDLPRVSEEAARRGYPPHFQGMVDGGTSPRKLFPQGRSIVVLAYDYARHRYPENLLRHVSRTYLSRSYLPVEGSPARDRLDAFEAFLAGEGIAFEPDRNALMMRPAALRAGVISFGRNNFAYVDDVGSFVILYGYLVDAELPPPTSRRPTASACPAAMRASTRARRARSRSRSTSTWSGACSGKTSCPRVATGEPTCPLDAWAISPCACTVATRARRRAPAIAAPCVPTVQAWWKTPCSSASRASFSLEGLLHMPDGFYEECVFPIMYNYVRDTAIFQRNAAIAMGNSGDVRYVSHLRAELGNPDPAVRAHVE